MQNLATNPKCSLLVAKEPEDRGTLVVTLHGDAVAVRYIAYFFFPCVSLSHYLCTIARNAYGMTI